MALPAGHSARAGAGRVDVRRIETKQGGKQGGYKLRRADAPSFMALAKTFFFFATMSYVPVDICLCNIVCVRWGLGFLERIIVVHIFECQCIIMASVCLQTMGQKL